MVKKMTEEKNKEEIQIIKGPLPYKKVQTEYETYYKYFEKINTLSIVEE